MKLLGTIKSGPAWNSKTKVIVEMSGDEFANVVGVYNFSLLEGKFSDLASPPTPTREWDVSKEYHDMRNIRSKMDDFKQAITILRGLADALEVTDSNLVKLLAKEEKPNE